MTARNDIIKEIELRLGGQMVDIEAASGNVGGNQNLD